MKLAWDAVTTYANGAAITPGTVLGYKVYWKTAQVGYNSVDVKDVGTSTECDLTFLLPDLYELAASCYQGTNESVRSMGLPFVNIPPASPVGLYVS
jgi:hypothetical protein